MVANKTPSKSQRDPMPEQFGSAREAAEFWDTHDSADYEDFLREVPCEVNIRRRAVLVSLDTKLYRKLHSTAAKKGLSTAALLNLWAQEKAS
jgi:hypothetical protein